MLNQFICSFNWLTGLSVCASIWPDPVRLARFQKGVFIWKRSNLFIPVETIETHDCVYRHATNIGSTISIVEKDSHANGNKCWEKGRNLTILSLRIIIPWYTCSLLFTVFQNFPAFPRNAYAYRTMSIWS